MITAGEAEAAAAAALAGLVAESDAMLKPWPMPAVGAPVTVEDIDAGPAYWLVPFMASGHVIGSARVDAAGRVMTIGMNRAATGRVGDLPRVVTLLTADEAAIAARAMLEPGEDARPPRFVHDGPRWREAWLVETRRAGRRARWITITPGGTSARTAGIRLGDDSSRE